MPAGPDSKALTVSNLIAALSLLVALAVAALSLFAGSRAQTQWDAERASCLDALTRFGSTLVTLGVGRTGITPAEEAQLVIAEGQVNIYCFTQGIIDRESDFRAKWTKASAGLTPVCGLYPAGVEPDPDDGCAAIVVSDRVVSDVQLAATNVAIEYVSGLEGPGPWPWEHAVPGEPDWPVDEDADAEEDSE